LEKLTQITGEKRGTTTPVGSMNAGLEESQESESEEEGDGEKLGPTRRKESFIVKPTFADDIEHSVFKGAGEKGGLEIWRIEKMIPVPLPLELYGTFANEDCYVVLWTEFKSEGTISELFYWLGQDCQLDKSASAAIR
jgi:gelsolin